MANINPQEVARILRDAADKIEAGVKGGKLLDINGNTVGDFGLRLPVPGGRVLFALTIHALDNDALVGGGHDKE